MPLVPTGPDVDLLVVAATTTAAATATVIPTVEPTTAPVAAAVAVLAPAALVAAVVLVEVLAPTAAVSAKTGWTSRTRDKARKDTDLIDMVRPFRKVEVCRECKGSNVNLV